MFVEITLKLSQNSQLYYFYLFLVVQMSFLVLFIGFYIDGYHERANNLVNIYDGVQNYTR